jgi:LysR family transcriptional regulator, transcription activator of glutamate synthase operon
VSPGVSAELWVPRRHQLARTLATSAGLVAAGLGVSLMPIDGTEHAPGVTTLPLADTDAYRDVGLIWNSAKPLSRPARNFVASAATIRQRANV